MTEQLAPCPFCGGPAREIMGLVGCEQCALARRDAASWNRRAPAPDAREALEAAERLLRALMPWGLSAKIGRIDFDPISVAETMEEKYGGAVSQRWLDLHQALARIGGGA